MEKIKVTGSLIELSEDDRLLTVDMKALVRVQRNKKGSEISSWRRCNRCRPGLRRHH